MSHALITGQAVNDFEPDSRAAREIEVAWAAVFNSPAPLPGKPETERMTKRGALAGRLVRKAVAPIPAAPVEVQAALLPEALAPEVAAPVAETRDMKVMMCRGNRAGRSKMSKLTIDRGMSLEDMLIDACNELLRQPDRPPAIEERSPQARRP